MIGVSAPYSRYTHAVRGLTGVPVYLDRLGVNPQKIPYGNDPTRWIPELSALLVQSEGLLSSQVIEPLTGHGLKVTYAPFEGRSRTIDFSDPRYEMYLGFWWARAPSHKLLAGPAGPGDPCAQRRRRRPPLCALIRPQAALVRAADPQPMNGPNDIEVSIVMPCLNEEESIRQCIAMAQEGLERAGAVGEIVIADNGSTDGSQEIARGLGARVVDVPAKGYGAALMGGFEAARGRYVIMGDADDSYDFGHIEAFVERLRAGDDLVMGNRFRGGIEDGAMPFLHRYLGNPVLSFVGRLLFRSAIGDFHCGLRGFRREILPALDLQSPGMEFASEMVVKATLDELRISEVPTTLSPDAALAPAAPAHLARRLAAPALPAPLQPALALLLSRAWR